MSATEPTTYPVVYRLDNKDLADAMNALGVHICKGGDAVTALTIVLKAYATAANSPEGLEVLRSYISGFAFETLLDMAGGGLKFCNPTCDCPRCQAAKSVGEASRLGAGDEFLAYFKHYIKECAFFGEPQLTPSEALAEFTALPPETRMVAASKDYWQYWRKSRT